MKKQLKSAMSPVVLFGSGLLAMSFAGCSPASDSPATGGGSGGGAPVAGTPGAGSPGSGGTPGVPLPGAGTGPTAGAASGGTGPGPTAGTGPTAGAPSGGMGTGGALPTAGAGGLGTTGGSDPGTGGTGGGGGTTPPGYWKYGNLKGCVWTGIDTLPGTTTTNTPKDFTMQAAGGPYCVKGTVHADYEAVALLGFNLNEPETASCVYKPVDPNASGPPAVMLNQNGATGLAINFAKNAASTLRVQIQGPNGASDPNDRWCYTIADAAGPVFAPFNEFNTQCWDGKGTNYTGQPISAVVFLVPGTTTATPFDYCINGFAPGTSKADAPTGGVMGGTLMGTIGGEGSTDLDFERVKVVSNGKSYIIQNNNWGNPGGSNQKISYKGASFTVESSTGNKGGNGEPASFPSIFIGGNGDTANGAFSTRSDDGLPKQISAIQSVMSTFKYNRANGDYNATYDIWFANSPPTQRYNDAISGFVMLWLYKPAGNNPIGSVMGTYNGGGATWDVYVGPRGGGGPNSNAPVVSYVAKSTLMSFSGDLKPFMVEAGKYGINQSWYLTDVFAGFEIWTGSSANGLAVTEFSAVVQ